MPNSDDIPSPDVVFEPDSTATAEATASASASVAAPKPAPAPAAPSSPEKPKVEGKMMTVEEIEALLQGHASLDRPSRKGLLVNALYTAQQLWYSGSDDLALVAEKLADGSRNPPWRLPLGDSGILEFFLGVLAVDTIREPLKRHVLRLIGNCCADTDENRARVVAANAMPSIVAQLSDDAVIQFAIQVLYNTLIDYEPAQVAASNAGLGLHLGNLLSSSRVALCRPLLNMMGSLLELLVAHTSEANVTHRQMPFVLLSLTLNPDLDIDPEDYLLFASVALSYLSFPNLQTNFLTSDRMPTLLASFYHLATQLEPSSPELGQELATQLRQLRSTYTQHLADLCYLPTFASVHPLGSPVMQTLQSWLDPSCHTALQSAACLCLGNMARSDETSVALVNVCKIHTPAIAIVASQLPGAQPLSQSQHQQQHHHQQQQQPQPPQSQPIPDPLLLHSVLSLLKNLAIPPTTKPLLGELLNPTYLPAIWSLDPNLSLHTPQIQFAAVSLARLLLVSTPSNVRRLCARLSPDPLSPLHELTNLHRLLDLFKRSNPESAAHTRTEAARAALAVVRVLHTTHVPPVIPEWNPDDEGYVFRSETSSSALPLTAAPPPRPPPPPGTTEEAEPPTEAQNSPIREKFYLRHGDLPQVLSYLVTQPKFPVLRSEAWFVFALMSRTKEGAYVVTRALQPPGAWNILFQGITGRKTDNNNTNHITPSPQAPESVASLDGDTLVDEGTGLSIVADSGQQRQGGGDDDVAADLGLEPRQADPAAHGAGMERVDRENGLVLVTELLRSGTPLSGARRTALEEVLREGGELVGGGRGSRVEELG